MSPPFAPLLATPPASLPSGDTYSLPSLAILRAIHRQSAEANIYHCMTIVGLNQVVLASTASLSPLPSFTQSAGQQAAEPMILAAGVGTRVERKHSSAGRSNVCE